MISAASAATRIATSQITGIDFVPWTSSGHSAIGV